MDERPRNYRRCLLVGLVLGVGCAPSLSTHRVASSATKIHKIQFMVGNVFAIESGGGVVIVDAGDSGKHGDILKALDRLSIERNRVKLLVITHAHADHAGSALKLAKELSVPIALGVGDVSYAQAGRGAPLHPTSIVASLLKLFLKHDYPAFTPKIVVSGCLDLRKYGVAGTVIETRGHTPGSIIVVLDGGDAIVGDITSGGYLGGLVGPRFPTEHYMQEHPDRTDAIVEWLLSSGVTRLHVGHGGPLSVDAIRKRQRNGNLNRAVGVSFVPAGCAAAQTNRPRS